MQELAQGAASLPLTIENVYFVGKPGDPWFLIDTGTPGMASKILAAARARYGDTARPKAIFLTHGHTDHAGSAAALAEAWNVPIYAHFLELPYITGHSKYPPKDPTVGGAMAMISRVFPMDIVNLNGLVEPLPADGVVPGFPDWQWHFTPGHSPGHVSYFSPDNSLLLAGDAFATVNMASLADLMTKKPEINLPPTPFTCDWEAARRSVGLLASLNPTTIGCGHGRPLSGPTLPNDLRRFSETFTPPAHGRYVGSPAVTNANGIVSLPPPAPDLFPVQAAAVATVFAGAYALSKKK
ncbi:MAG: MBL fold metallo-hydrolase [Janthinobacterium lividum]